MTRKTQQFKIKGMHCDACGRVISRRIKKIPGVTDFEVNLSEGIVDIMSERLIEMPEIREQLKDTEYTIQ